MGRASEECSPKPACQQAPRSGRWEESKHQHCLPENPKLEPTVKSLAVGFQRRQWVLWEDTRAVGPQKLGCLWWARRCPRRVGYFSHFFFLIGTNMHSTEFTTSTTLSVRFSGFKSIQTVVQPTPLSISRTFHLLTLKLGTY